MSSYKYTISNPKPDLFNDGYIGSTELYGGTGKKISNVQALLSNGNATINVSISDRADPIIDPDDIEDTPPLFHLRGHDLGSPMSASQGDAVADWYTYDHTVSRFRQASSGNRPSYETTKGCNSNEGCYFSGSSQYMTRLSGFSDLAYDADFTMFLALGKCGNDSNANIIGKFNNTDDTWRTHWGNWGGNHTVRNENGNTASQSGDDIDDDQIRTLKCVNNNTTQSRLWEWKDGTSYYSNNAITIDSSGGGWNFDAMAIASRYYRSTFTAHYAELGISELICYSGALSDTHRQIIEGYLAHKYGVEGNLPSSHPYYSTDPRPSNTMLFGSDLTLTKSLQSLGNPNQAVSQGQRLNVFLPEAQNVDSVTLTFTIAGV